VVGTYGHEVVWAPLDLPEGLLEMSIAHEPTLLRQRPSTSAMERIWAMVVRS